MLDLTKEQEEIEKELRKKAESKFEETKKSGTKQKRS